MRLRELLVEGKQVTYEGDRRIFVIISNSKNKTVAKEPVLVDLLVTYDPDDKKGKCKIKKIYPDEDDVSVVSEKLNIDFPLIMDGIHKRVKRDFKYISDFKKYGIKGKPLLVNFHL